MSKSKYTSEFKIKVLEEGHFESYCLQRSNLLKKQNEEKTQVREVDYETGEVFYYEVYPSLIREWENENRDNPYFDCSKKLFKSRNGKMTRIRKRIYPFIMKKRGYFLTLTFRDEELEKSTPKERRKKVCRFLKEYSSNYVANVDFGGEHEYADKNLVKIATKREHYHVIIDKPLVHNQWPFGESYCKHIFSTKLDMMRVSKYIAKLSLESLKTNKENVRVIYSKSK